MREVLRYKPSDRYRSPVDPGRCRASVHDTYGVEFHQCARKPAVGEWCRQHSPEAIQKRETASKRRYEDEMKQRTRARVAGGLRDATTADLIAELQRRGRRVPEEE